MNSATGKRLRLGRLLSPGSGRGIIVAYSHGLLLGPQQGLRTLEEMRDTVLACEAADGIMIAPGLVDRLSEGFAGRGRPAMVVHLDWTNFSRRTLPAEQGSQVPVAEIEDVVAAGADAIMSYLLVGFDDSRAEAMEIERNARLARACDRWGVPLMIEPRYARERAHPEGKLDPAIMQLYCRISAEIGADLVKAVWPGSVDAMRELALSCPAPILIAGGVRDPHSPGQHLCQARDAIAGGARGLVYGRNVYQSPDPAKTLAELRAIVHDSGAPAEPLTAGARS